MNGKVLETDITFYPLPNNRANQIYDSVGKRIIGIVNATEGWSLSEIWVNGWNERKARPKEAWTNIIRNESDQKKWKSKQDPISEL